MDGRIFINYRRGAASGHAMNLYERLSRHFGEDRVFIDVDRLKPGRDFVDSIEEALDESSVLLALIAEDWNQADSDGQPRLENPSDFVRMEIAKALQRRRVAVIPVLLDRTEMPTSLHLPEDLVPLTRRHAFELSTTSWNRDIEGLIEALEEVLGPSAGSATARSGAPGTGAAHGQDSQTKAARDTDSDSTTGSDDRGPALDPSWLKLGAGALVAILAVVAAVVLLGGSGDDDPAEPDADFPPASAYSVQAKAEVSFPTGVSVGDGEVWVASDDVYTLNKSSGDQAGAPVDVGDFPQEVHVGEGAVWVTVASDEGDDDGVARIDPISGQQDGETIGIDAPGATTTGFDAVWVLSRSEETLTKIDPATDSVVDEISLDGREPFDVLAAGEDIWVTSIKDDNVIRLDPETLEDRGEPVSPGDEPLFMAADESGLWVTNNESGTVSRVDLETGEPDAPIRLEQGTNPAGIDLGLGYAWVLNGSGRTLIPIDLETMTPEAPITVGENPQAVAVGEDTVWVALGEANKVARVATR